MHPSKTSKRPFGTVKTISIIKTIYNHLEPLPLMGCFINIDRSVCPWHNVIALGRTVSWM